MLAYQRWNFAPIIMQMGGLCRWPWGARHWTERSRNSEHGPASANLCLIAPVYTHGGYLMTVTGSVMDLRRHCKLLLS